MLARGRRGPARRGRSSARRSGCSSARRLHVRRQASARRVDAVAARSPAWSASWSPSGCCSRPWPTCRAGRPARRATRASPGRSATVLPDRARHARGAAQPGRRRRFPQVFDALRPAARRWAAPPAESGLTRPTAEQVAASTVRVEGEACGRRPGRQRLRRRRRPGGHQRPRGRRAASRPPSSAPTARRLRRRRWCLRPRPRPGARCRCPASTVPRSRAATPTSARQRRACSATPAAGRCGSSPFEVGEQVDADRREHLRPRPRPSATSSSWPPSWRPATPGGRSVDPTGRVVGRRVRHRARPAERRPTPSPRPSWTPCSPQPGSPRSPPALHPLTGGCRPATRPRRGLVASDRGRR